MRRYYDKQKVSAAIAACPYREVLESLNIEMFLIVYQPGEFITSPFDETLLFQIICDGELSVYYIRDDGSRYALAQGSETYCVGEAELYNGANTGIFSEAISRVTCIAFSITENKDVLLNNILFMQLINQQLVQKLSIASLKEASHYSLKERVLDYMKYKCEDGVLKGIEKTAFILHCSDRQLQRILNDYERQNVIKKVGKGTYRLV